MKNRIDKLIEKENLEELKKIFLEKPELIEIEIESGLRPLHRSIQDGKTDIAEMLIELGADINAETEYGDTPLIWAAYNGDIELIKLLINKGADIHYIRLNGNYNISHYIHNSWFMTLEKEKELFEIITDNGVDFTIISEKGESLFDFIYNGNGPISYKELLERLDQFSPEIQKKIKEKRVEKLFM